MNPLEEVLMSSQTLELIRALPQDFLSHKASVARIQFNAEADPFHARQHFGQIKKALEAAS